MHIVCVCDIQIFEIYTYNVSLCVMIYNVYVMRQYGRSVLQIEEVVKDFRAITNKYMLKLENCKESLEGLKSGIEVFQSERLTNGNHMARRRAKWLGEKIKRSIKAAKQSAALD